MSLPRPAWALRASHHTDNRHADVLECRGRGQRPMSGQVLLELDGPIARVTLSHPGKFNAMSRAMWRQLREVFTGLQHDAGLRAVLVRGEGGHFCAGGDIAEYADFRFEVQSLRSFHEDEVWAGLSAMLDCDLPVLAQIEGNCMGAGVEMVSCCDLRLASASARFGAPIALLAADAIFHRRSCRLNLRSRSPYRQVDVFRKPLDDTVGFGKRGAAFECQVLTQARRFH